MRKCMRLHFLDRFPMNRKKTIHLLVLAAALLSVISPLRAQSTPPSDALFKTIQSLDTQLFDAYNHCDLAKLSSFVTEDLEFYHDKTGLARGRQAFVDAVKNNICGKDGVPVRSPSPSLNELPSLRTASE
jgi:hypothetical protein